MENDLYVKDYIIQGLLNLLPKKQFDKISITDICEKAGVSRISFYRNFKSKEDILKKYIDSVTDKFVQSQPFKYNSQKFKDYIIILFEHLITQKDFSLLLYKNNLLYLIKDEFDKYFLKNATNKNEQFNQMFIAGGLFNIFQFWLINGSKESPKELSEMFFNFIYSN